MKVSGGLIHGRGTSQSVKSQWILGSRCSSLICAQLEDYCGTQSTTVEQHVDWRDSRRIRDNNDTEKVYQWFIAHEPFSERK